MKTDNQQETLVSVIIPAYNAEKLIGRTLTSVINQTYSNLEILVIDDGSQDGTEAIVRDFMQRDERVKFWQQENAGVAAARNLGIQKAKGEFIAPIDADDLWHPENIEKQVQCLINCDSSVGLTYAWSVDIDENDVIKGEVRASTIEGNVYTILLLHDFIANASSTVIRRCVFEKIGGYNSDLREKNAQGGEDWELYLRIAEVYEFRVIPRFLIGYRRLSDSMSSDGTAMAQSRLEIWQSVWQKYPKVPKIIYRLSMGSFYMYLARQNSLYYRHKQAIYWLSQALKLDYLTPFLRLGLYRLLFRSYFKLGIDPISETIEREEKFWQKSTFVAQSDQSFMSFVELKISSANQDKVKPFIEKALFRLIPVILGTPERWQKREGITNDRY